MTPEQFCYWLQGAFETMDEGRGLSSFDHTIRDHLQTVFKKVTPEWPNNPHNVPNELRLDEPNTHKIIC